MILNVQERQPRQYSVTEDHQAKKLPEKDHHTLQGSHTFLDITLKGTSKTSWAVFFQSQGPNMEEFETWFKVNYFCNTKNWTMWTGRLDRSSQTAI